MDGSRALYIEELHDQWIYEMKDKFEEMDIDDYMKGFDQFSLSNDATSFTYSDFTEAYLVSYNHKNLG